MESVIFQCASFLERAVDKSRETKKSTMGFTVAILGRERRVRAQRVFMELKIEKLFGEEFAGKLAPGRGDVPVLLPVRSVTIRSFLRLSRAYYVGENPRYHFPRLAAISLFENLFLFSLTGCNFFREMFFISVA